MLVEMRLFLLGARIIRASIVVLEMLWALLASIDARRRTLLLVLLRTHSMDAFRELVLFIILSPLSEESDARRRTRVWRITVYLVFTIVLAAARATLRSFRFLRIRRSEAFLATDVLALLRIVLDVLLAMRLRFQGLLELA